MSWQDLAVMVAVVLLLLGGRWLDSFGTKIGEGIRRFKDGGPGGPTAA